MKNKFKFILNKRFLILTCLLFVYGIFLIPGPRGANDFPFNSISATRAGFDLPYLWSPRGGDGLGEYVVSTRWAWPMDVVYGLGATLGISFSVLERIFGILATVVLGYFSVGLLMDYFKVNGWGKYIATFFFLTNTYLLLLIDGGQLAIALSFALFPLCFLMIDKAIGGTFRNQLIASLSVVVLGFFDIRFIYILVMFLVIRFVYLLLVEKRWKDWKWLFFWVRLGVVFTFIFVLLNGYWILPILFVKASFLPVTYTSAVAVDSLSFTSLGHAILLQQPNWFKNVFGDVSLPQASFILIPFLVFLAPLLRKRDKTVGFWLLVALVGVFLVKGSQEPFPQIYTFLFTKIPGFSLFRDSSKFFFLVGLSYTVLIGISVQEISQLKFKKVSLNRLFKIVPFLVLIYFVWIVRPTYLIQMTGLFAPQVYQSSYLKLADYLSSDTSYGLVSWIPERAPLGFTSPLHPSIGLGELSQKRPFEVGTVGTYETFNFLREASFSGQLLDVAGISYIAYPPLDPRRDNMKPDNVNYYYTFLNQLENLPWISQERPDAGIPLLLTETHQDKVFKTKNLWWVIGSDDLYSESTKSANLTLSKNALVFADEYPGLSNRLNEFPQAKIVLNRKTLTDLAASFIPSNEFIFPAKNLNSQPDQTGWWKRTASDLISWKDFLLTKYGIHNQDFDLGGGWAVGEGAKTLNVSVFGKRGDILLARVLESTRSGQLNFSGNGNSIGTILTQKAGDDVRWFQVGSIPNDSNAIIITAQGDINVVNALAVLKPDQWQNFQNEANNFSSRVEDFNEKDAENTEESSQVTFQEINQTQYKVTVSGLTNPQFIVLSQNYNNLWELNGSSSVPVYSMLNGFEVNRNGEYIINFVPQKYVTYGLFVSGTTLLVILGFLLISRKNTASTSG